MKKWLSLGLSVLLLLVFTTAPTSYAVACCSKNAKKEIQTATQSQKNCCKAQAKCKKACCKKDKDIAHHNKKQCEENGCKGDCNGSCSCSVSVFTYAVLEQSTFNLPHLVPFFEEKQSLSFQKSFPKSVIIAFWQPPKI